MELLTTVGFAVAFFALIMVSVALHEIGHMVPAKLFGVRPAVLRGIRSYPVVDRAR